MGDLVSIIIPCYNQGQFVSEAIDSVLANTYENIEIIVVNDGSPTEVDQYVNPYIERGEITYVKQYNQGVSVARNNGIRLSQGKYVVCLDADDKLSEDYIETIYNQMAGRNAIIAAPHQSFGRENNLWSPTVPNDSIFVLNCIPVNAMFSKDMWQDLGGFDETMKLGYEDWEFWVHAYVRGYKFEVAKTPRVFYRRWEESLNSKAIANHEMLKQYISKKHRA